MEQANTPKECPFCKSMLIPLEDVSAATPGDFTACTNCGEYLEFDKNLNLFPLSDETIDKINGAQLMRARKTVELFRLLSYIEETPRRG